MFSCGSDEPADSGYGANQPVPPARTCAAACQRLADCGVKLCREDTGSVVYDEMFVDVLAEQCELNCDDASVQSGFTAEEWTCTFTDTCREVMGNDSCSTGASYTCENTSKLAHASL